MEEENAMTRLTVLGGTGYAGGAIVAEAARRHHPVTAYSRTAPVRPVDGVTYVQGDVLDADVLDVVFDDADVVVHALSPRGELEHLLVKVAGDIAERADRASVRLGVVGSAGSLTATPGGPALIESPDTPEQFRAEGLSMYLILEELRTSPATLDWFSLTPDPGFGSHAPGESTGRFRLGGDVLLTGGTGRPISGADFATALLDEVETPRHHRQQFSVAY